jgi:hypothetical protein
MHGRMYADIKKAPVQTELRSGVLTNGQRRISPTEDVHSIEDDLQAVEITTGLSTAWPPARSRELITLAALPIGDHTVPDGSRRITNCNFRRRCSALIQLHIVTV